MFAILSTAWVIPGLIGPAIAALVAAAASWRWVFLGLVPLVVVSGVLAVLAMKHVPAPRRPRSASVPYLPVFGVVAGAALALASISSGELPAVVGGAIAGGSLLVVCLRRLTPPGTLSAQKWFAGHHPQPRPVDLLFFRRRRLCPVCHHDGPAFIHRFGRSGPYGGDLDVDGGRMGPGPPHRPARPAPLGPVG